MYDAIGVRLTADAEARCAAGWPTVPASRRGPPTRLATYGLSDDQIDERFAAYNARFRVRTPYTRKEERVSDDTR